MDDGYFQYVIGIGTKVYYYSETHGTWFDTTVTRHNFVDGRLQSYDLAIKRHAQISRVSRCAEVPAGFQGVPAGFQLAPLADGGSQEESVESHAAKSSEVASPADGGIPEAPTTAAGSSEMPPTPSSPEVLEVGAGHESVDPHAAEFPDAASPADGGIPEDATAAGSSEIPPTSGSAEVPEGGAVVESLEPAAAELPEQPDDALSAVLESEPNESEVDVWTQIDALSVVSTAAPDALLDDVGHGRRAPRARRLYPPPCYCDCHDAPHRDLFPPESAGPHVRRCQCPMCGHRSVEGGQGCHIRVGVAPRSRGLVLCTNCTPFCLRFLRWGDVFYDNGGVWPGGRP